MKKLLIVDDDTALQTVYQEMFTEAGFTVFIASNGELGLQIARSEKPDAILVDLILPGVLNGIELIKKLKSDPKTKNITITVVSNLDSEKKTSLAAGADHFFAKTGIYLEELVKALGKST